MDINRLSLGDKIAGGAAIALLLIMFIFKWFGIEAEENIAGIESSVTWNAWQAFSFIDIILFVTILAALGMAYVHASRTSIDLPVSLSVIVTALGILSALLILFRIISPPDFEIAGFDITGEGFNSTREIGAFLGLIAAAALAYGGFRAMDEEGTSFQEAGDQLRDRNDGPGAGTGGTGTTGSTGAPPPPPAGGTASPPPSGGTTPPPPPPPPSSNA